MEPGTDELRGRYEQLPYPGGTYRFTHPDRLAVTARLRGLSAPAVETARVLEIGCGTGINAVAMAAWLPAAQIVGVDLSEDILAEGQAVIDALGLANVQLHAGAIEGLPEDLGPFDYVICHGVFSWVPGDVQDALLAAVSRLLASDGLAYISYNTAPGWLLQGYVRDFMLRMAPTDDPETACRAGRQLLGVAAQLDPAGGPHVALLANAAQELAEQPDGYLFHDYLTPINTPIYFQDFVAWAHQHQLTWVGEARPGEHRRFALADAPQRLVDAVGDEIVREELLDFLRARRFRRSVLSRLRPPRDPEAVDALSGLFVVIRAVPLSEQIALDDGVVVTFQTRDELDIGVSDGALKGALSQLWERHPEPVSVEELLLGAGNAGTLAAALRQMYELEVIDLAPRRVPVQASPPERPCVAPFVRYLAEQGETWVLNGFHERGQVGPLERELIRLSDGTRDTEALLDGLVDAVASGRLTAHVGDDTVDDLAAIRSALERMVPAGIAEMLSLGLLVPG